MKQVNTAAPSSNWLALKKTLPKSSRASLKATSRNHSSPSRKRRRATSVSTDGGGVPAAHDGKEHESFPRGVNPDESISTAGPSTKTQNSSGAFESNGIRESKENLRRMILGQTTFSDAQLEPGRYLALDCEMVGVGLDGDESSLARVSMVNYHGAVMLDVFVRQRERVLDYRTFVSGVRESDMVKAKPFMEVQKEVAELLKDRVLVGHAVFNDLKALLLSHPRPSTRDTQLCAGKAKLLKTKYPALRKLVQQEFGIDIQGGEHSSVTDARATMALYRLHRKEWDKNWRPPPNVHITAKAAGVKQLKRKRNAEDDEGEDTASDDVTLERSTTGAKREKGNRKDAEGSRPGDGRKGVSSGLSTIVRRAGTKGIERVVKSHGRHTSTASTSAASRSKAGSSEKWWATLGGGRTVSKVSNSKT